MVSDDSGNGDSITMTITDASSAIFSLFKTKAIAANATTEMIYTGLSFLLENEVLKAQATTADRLHVIVSLLEINKGINMFIEEGEVAYTYINGKKVPVVKCETGVILRNKETGYEYGSDKEAEDDIANPDSATKKEHVVDLLK